MDCDQGKNTCVASGNASAEKLNDSKTQILKADKITAHFSKEGGSGSMKPDQLKADGNVRFKLDDIFVQGDRGDYDVGTEVIKVYSQEDKDGKKGNVKITNGENQVSGKSGEVNMKTGKYSVRGDGERVEALIYTKEEKPNKDGLLKD